MIRINKPSDGYTIAKAAGTAFNPVTDQVIARITSEGNVLGGVLYQNYTGASTGMHVASFDPHWINRDMLWVCFDYPFNQLGCRAVFGQIPSDNLKALAFDLKLGFKEITRLQDVFPDADLIVVRMLREECRWLRLKPVGLESRKAA